MRTILVLVRKDFANFFRNKAAVSLTFLVPFALIWVFGWVFGVNRTDTGPSGIPLAVVNASADPGAVKLVDALQAEKAFKVVTTTTDAAGAERTLREEDLEPLMRANRFRFAVVIPADLVGEAEFGLHLKIYNNPRNEIETQMVNGILQKTIFANVPQLLGQSLLARGRGLIGAERQDAFNRAIADNVARSFGGNADDILKGIERGDFGFGEQTAATGATGGAAVGSLMEQVIRIESVQVAGQDVKSPAATRIVGGWAVQFLLFSLSAAATALFYERDYGIFHRILAGPVGRSQILWSKFTYGVCIGLLQLIVLFIGGRFLYGIDVENHFGMLLLVCAFAAAACTAFGMLIASVSSSPEAASGLATFLILLMCAVGGAWFPVAFMPEFMQQASQLTLVYWAMEGFAQVLWADATLAELAPTLGILGGITAVVMAVAVWRFNRGNIFG
jgi:ABC-2 type transport system permease protein